VTTAFNLAPAPTAGPEGADDEAPPPPTAVQVSKTILLTIDPATTTTTRSPTPKPVATPQPTTSSGGGCELEFEKRAELDKLLVAGRVTTAERDAQLRLLKRRCIEPSVPGDQLKRAATVTCVATGVGATCAPAFATDASACAALSQQADQKGEGGSGGNAAMIGGIVAGVVVVVLLVIWYARRDKEPKVDPLVEQFTMMQQAMGGSGVKANTMNGMGTMQQPPQGMMAMQQQQQQQQQQQRMMMGSAYPQAQMQQGYMQGHAYPQQQSWGTANGQAYPNQFM